MFIIYLSIKRYLLLKILRKTHPNTEGRDDSVKPVVLKNKKEVVCIRLMEADVAFLAPFFRKVLF
ncbi:MAG: hypothetical protein QXR19_17710 [Candidatus Jordarchaeaceae archaeon]